MLDKAGGAASAGPAWGAPLSARIGCRGPASAAVGHRVAESALGRVLFVVCGLPPSVDRAGPGQGTWGGTSLQEALQTTQQRFTHELEQQRGAAAAAEKRSVAAKTQKELEMRASKPSGTASDSKSFSRREE